jgi:hypothetical protein
MVKVFTKNGKLNWTWPTSEAEDGIDFATGLYKKYYAEKDWRKSCLYD